MLKTYVGPITIIIIIAWFMIKESHCTSGGQTGGGGIGIDPPMIISYKAQ